MNFILYSFQFKLPLLIFKDFDTDVFHNSSLSLPLTCSSVSCFPSCISVLGAIIQLHSLPFIRQSFRKKITTFCGIQRVLLKFHSNQDWIQTKTTFKRSCSQVKVEVNSFRYYKQKYKWRTQHSADSNTSQTGEFPGSELIRSRGIESLRTQRQDIGVVEFMHEIDLSCNQIWR